MVSLSSSFPNPNDKTCLLVAYMAMSSIFVFLAGVRTFVYAQDVQSIDKMKAHWQEKSMPLALDVCEAGATMPGENGLVGSFDAFWWPHDFGSHITPPRLPVHPVLYSIRIGDQDLRCARFSVPKGTPPLIQHAWIGSMYLSAPQSATATMAVDNHECQVLDVSFRVSCAEDPLNRYATKVEGLVEWQLPAGGSNCTKKIQVGGERHLTTWRDSFGGRKGAPYEDTGQFKLTQEAGPSSVHNIGDEHMFSGKAFLTKVEMHILAEDVLHEEFLNDVIAETGSYLASLLAYVAVYKMITFLFVPSDPVAVRFKFYWPSLGLGAKPEEQEPLVCAA